MNTKGNVIADKEIDKNTFRLSIFLDMGKWHHFMEWLYGKNVGNKFDHIILYLSFYRGESINLTLSLKGIIEKVQWIDSFLKDLKVFLAINAVDKQKSISCFNGAIFKDFTPNNIYYGIHPESIENFQYESFEDDLQLIKVKITDIILSELREKKVNKVQLLAFSIILIKVVTDSFCRRGFTNTIVPEKTSISIEESKYRPNDSISSLILRYIEFANEVVDELMTEQHYLKLRSTIENILDSLAEENHEKIKSIYLWILRSICVQLGIEEEIYSQIYLGIQNFQKMHETHA
ncbi:hypothetical protein [Olivibacter jilunii]|uniref:hypothetical protein n=1 Tax=Olivibacter jilunii TaxID=985016 RepID=UPI003F19101C